MIAPSTQNTNMTEVCALAHSGSGKSSLDSDKTEGALIITPEWVEEKMKVSNAQAKVEQIYKEISFLEGLHTYSISAEAKLRIITRINQLREDIIGLIGDEG